MQTSCLDEHIAHAFVSGELPVDEFASVEAHLAGCEACRQVMSQLVRQMSRTGPTVAGGGGIVLANLEPGTVLGRYVVRERLGAGGMGMVYKAYDPGLARTVALKIWAVGRGPATIDQAREQLIGEAQALARLAHPNVVTVHDVGSFDDDEVFVAMEYVEGDTLRQWLRRSPPLAQILAVFRDAGRGLAAAHAAGIVHRDFKPDNVIVGKDGRVRVLDFGLARATRSHGEAAGSEAAGGVSTIAGTPGYMAPEQLRAGVLDERTDQFAFSVALHEAVFGAKPWTANDPESVLAGRRRPLTDVPAERRWLLPVLARGLAAEPADRFPDMAGLLAALDPRPRRRLAAVAAGVAVVGGLLAALGLARPEPAAAFTRCPAGPPLAGVWDARVRVAVDRAFAAVPESFARDARERVVARLDGWAIGWSAAHGEACRAPVASGKREALAAEKLRCLERQRGQVGAMAALLAGADRGLVQRAPRVLADLPGPGECKDVLLAAAPPPPGAADRGEVAALGVELARCEALRWAGRYADAVACGTDALARAEQLGYAPAEAEASFALGYAESYAGLMPAAEKHLLAAARTAAASQHSALFARTAVVLVGFFGVDQRRPDEALAWARDAETALTRLGDPLDRRAVLEDSLGSIHYDLGGYGEARAHYRASLAAWRELGDADGVMAAAASNNLALVDHAEGHVEEAAAGFAAALAGFGRALGEQHPFIVTVATNLGSLHRELGHADEAEAYLRRADEVAVASFGERGSGRVDTLHELALLHRDHGQLERAASELALVLAIQEQELGADHPDVARTLDAQASVALRGGATDQAVSLWRRALGLYARTLGLDVPEAAGTRLRLAEALAGLGRCADALPEYRGAFAVFERAHAGGDHEDLAAARRGVLACERAVPALSRR